MNGADGVGYRPPQPVRHLPGRLNSVVQKVSQNRAQVHAPDIGAPGSTILGYVPEGGQLKDVDGVLHVGGNERAC